MELKEFIERALEEDLGSGDITTDATVESHQLAKAQIISKQPLVLAGIDIAKKVFLSLDPSCEWNPQGKDGEFLEKGAIIASLQGKATALLKAERLALNFLQHLSGIATLTKKFVEKTEGTKAKILDTRKTIPLWRALERFAVQMGGGNNHRLGLFDRYLIKSNHTLVAGSIRKAIEKVLQNKKPKFLVEVEVKNIAELKEAIVFPVDIILLDNFSVSQVKEALPLIPKRMKVEVSGGIHLDNVRDYALAGVDFISIGALTHSAPASDVHMVLR